MNQRRKTTITFAGIILAALLICGFLGYINDPRRGSGAFPEINNGLSATTGFIIKLNYCYSTAPSICIVSIGQDNANNWLIVIRNDIPSLKLFYLKIKETSNLQISECHQVQFSYDIFYCSGIQLLDGAMVTIEVYATNDNHLIASGLLQVSSKATPTQLLEVTKTPVLVISTRTPAKKSTESTPSTPTPSYPNPSYP